MRWELTIKKIYDILLNHYGPQGWWPIVNDKTLMCEYHTGAPKNESEQLEVSIGAILAQGTQWYPNVVRAIQQLKIGRPFTKKELNLIQYAESLYHKNFGNMHYKIDKPINAKIFKNDKKADITSDNISRKEQIITKDTILTQGTQWYPNVVRAIQQLKIGRPFTKEEIKLIQYAELLYHKEFKNKGCKIDKPINDKILNNCNEADITPADISRKEQIITKDTILTQNTSWKNVEKVLRNLKENDLLNKDKLNKINEKELANIIKSSGYHNQKAKKIKEFIKFLDSGKEINRKNLLNIWGIGKETADSILLYAYRNPIFVIDAYTRRIINRVGYEENGYDQLQELFISNLSSDPGLFNEYHALLVRLGKEICKKEPLCNICPLKNKCNYFKNKSFAESDK